MKKTTPRKLALRKTTLRHLGHNELTRIGGARDPDSDGVTCFCSDSCTDCNSHYFSGCDTCIFNP